ncbi:MAG: 30S ribosomal protein S11 [Candidatus Vogelbacteria bacterium]|nr:30S ribosomal protein S11 [Candidatus Vogelbacteria bacterium]
MGKKRVIKKGQTESDTLNKGSLSSKVSKRRLEVGTIHIQATYNNLLISLIDEKGGMVLSSSSGAMGFKGSKKGTPFAAGKVAENLVDKAQNLGLKEVQVVIKGVGAGRESAVRALISKGLSVRSITDVTPVPFNGPKPPRPRRV